MAGVGKGENIYFYRAIVKSMKYFPGAQKSRSDLVLLLLSIVLAVYIYYSPSIGVKHTDLPGNSNGYRDKASIFVIPGIALLVYLVFNFLGRYPWLLMKRAAGDEPPGLVRQTLLFWELLKLLCLLCMDALLITICFPGISWISLVFIGLFLLYTIIFLFKSLKKQK